jgi:hypothetical protein
VAYDQTLYLPEQNYYHAYKSMVKQHARVHKHCNYLMRANTLHKQHLNAYSQFVRKLLDEGKINFEEIAHLYTDRKDAIAKNPMFKNIK